MQSAPPTIDPSRAHPKLFEEEALPAEHRQWLEHADDLRAQGRLSDRADDLIEVGPGIGFVPIASSSERGCAVFVGVAALVLGALTGLSASLSWSSGPAYLAWGLFAVALLLVGVGLAFLGQLVRTLLPAYRRMERHWRGRAYGLFLFSDGFVLRSFPERVRHRPGWCGVRFFPWTAIVDVTTKTFSGTYQGAASTDAVLAAVRIRTRDGIEEITLPFHPDHPAYEGIRRWRSQARDSHAG